MQVMMIAVGWLASMGEQNSLSLFHMGVEGTQIRNMFDNLSRNPCFLDLESQKKHFKDSKTQPYSHDFQIIIFI